MFDKLKNKTINITIERYNIVGGVNKVMQLSKGLYKFIRAIELIIIIQGRNFKNVVNTYLSSENVPILWRKIFIKVANYKNNVYNRPKRIIQHCCQKHFCNLIKNNTEMNYD